MLGSEEVAKIEEGFNRLSVHGESMPLKTLKTLKTFLTQVEAV